LCLSRIRVAAARRRRRSKSESICCKDTVAWLRIWKHHPILDTLILLYSYKLLMHHQPLPKITHLSPSLISAGFSARLEVRDQRERSWQFLRMCFSKLLLLQQTQIFFINHQCRIQCRIGSERSERGSWLFLRMCFSKMLLQQTQIFFISHQCRIGSEWSWLFLRMCFSKMLLLQQTHIFFISH
jgi:hypothetical protein